MHKSFVHLVELKYFKFFVIDNNCNRNSKKQKVTPTTKTMTDIEAVSTDYVQQDGVQIQNQSSPTNNNRKSQTFLTLCDMRTATVVLNILNIFFTLVVAIVLTLLYAFERGPYKLQHIFQTLFGAFCVAGISSIGLYSAMNWRLEGMMAATAAFGLVFVMRLIKLEFIDVLITGLIFYVHVVFTMEMRSGVMTPETFEEEEYVAEGGRDFVEMAHSYVSTQNSMV